MACKMLERTVTEMVTVLSKLAETREPLRVSRTPVALKVSAPRGTARQVMKQPAPSPWSQDIEGTLGWPDGALCSGPKPNPQDHP